MPVRGVAHAVGRLGGLLKQMRQRHAEHDAPPCVRRHAEEDVMQLVELEEAAVARAAQVVPSKL